MNEFVTLCEQAARAGGKVLLDWVGRFQVHEKGPSDLVTDADLASQEAVREVLTTARPEFAFIGEESNLKTRRGRLRGLTPPAQNTPPAQRQALTPTLSQREREIV